MNKIDLILSKNWEAILAFASAAWGIGIGFLLVTLIAFGGGRKQDSMLDPAINSLVMATALTAASGRGMAVHKGRYH